MGGADASFGPFVLDRGRSMLLRDGKPVPVGQRGMALLDALISTDGPVTKQALMEAGWPGTIVEEGNLTVQIAGLRKALGEREDGSEWIVTVPRVGYRLVQGGGEASTAAGSTAVPLIAVLPFQNISSDPEQGYFADGVVEDIITALSRFRAFGVIARNSSFAFKGRTADARAVAAELGARYVLGGSVRRAGDRLRVSAQLIDGEAGVELWAQSFDGTVADVFDVQDKITESVAGVVEPQLRRAEIERARKPRPGHPGAYELYLQALPDVYATWPEENSRALRLLEQATALDPQYAPALAAMATTLMLRIAMQLRGASAGDRELCVASARRALATGSDDPVVLGTAGYALLQIGEQYEEGLALLRRASVSNPNSVVILTFYGIAHLLGGDLDDAEEILERALRLAPNDLGAHWAVTGLAHVRMAQGRFEEALQFAVRSLATNDRYDATYWMLIGACAHLGRLDEARAYLVRLYDVSPGVTLEQIRRGQRARDPQRIDVLIEGLRLAGMPET